jgi:hypothetical protein
MADEGMEVPAISERPKLEGYEWLWMSFLELTTCRQFGMGIGPIPWTATQKYAEANRLNQDEAWLLHKTIHRMDEVFIEHQRSKK